MILFRIFVSFALLGIAHSQTTVTSENFILVLSNKNYTAASAYCASNFGTKLASIHSKEEDDEAVGLCRDHGYTANYGNCWIGLSDIANQDDWVWDDGTVYDYQNWGTNQPSGKYGNSNEDCGELRKNLNYEWNDHFCRLNLYFLCNQPTSNPTTDPTIDPTPVPTKCMSHVPLSVSPLQKQHAC